MFVAYHPIYQDDPATENSHYGLGPVRAHYGLGFQWVSKNSLH